MVVIKKKSLIIGLLVILLIITGYLNFAFNNGSLMPAGNTNGTKGSSDKPGGNVTVTDPNENNGKTGDDSKETSSSRFFIDYRFEREHNRNKEIEYINSILDYPDSDHEIIKEAQAQLLELTSNMEAEAVIENLIKAKGFRDAIAIMHKNNVNIIVDKAELSADEVAQILEIVKRHSDFSTDNIVIIPKS